MADAYKKLLKKKKADGSDRFKFGIDGAWLLTPSRHGAHNHEGVGMLSPRSALSALAQHARLFRSFGPEETMDENDTDPGTSGSVSVLRSKRVDLKRILITGHSMGGHGAWIQATHYPDGLVGLAPAAGWLRKESYGCVFSFCFVLCMVFVAHG